MTYIGIDIGTSGCKVLALSAKGTVLSSHTTTYGLDQPRPGWTEQDPTIWIAAVQTALAQVLSQVPAASIRCIGLSGQMHGFTPVDRNGKVIRSAILWNDQRNQVEAAEIEDLAGGAETLLSLTNNRMLVGYTGGKILWLGRHERENFDRVYKALNPKDYLRLVLTGEFATEVSDASGTGLFDVRERKWSDNLLKRLPFGAEILPDCFESDVVSGQVSLSAAKLFGLPAGTPVIGGGGDSVIQTLGSGVVEPGVLQTTIGTAGIAAAALRTPEKNPDGRLQVFCNVAPNLWHCMGVSLNAGGALNWLRGAQGDCRDFDTMIAGASQVGPGASGLLFLPYLNGERCPHPDPKSRGAFVGLSARHDGRHMTRALMEGVTFALYDMYRLMCRIGLQTDLIKASGGGVKSPLWRQIQADLFNCPVVTTEGAAEGAAFGAALLAGVTDGAWTGMAEAARCCRELTREEPMRAQGDVYRKAHGIYAELYETLRPSLHALTELEAE